jgi:hypothetical protein
MPRVGDTVAITYTVVEVKNRTAFLAIDPSLNNSLDLEYDYDEFTGRIEVTDSEWDKFEWKRGPLPTEPGAVIEVQCDRLKRDDMPWTMAVRSNIAIASHWYLPTRHLFVQDSDIMDWRERA